MSNCVDCGGPRGGDNTAEHSLDRMGLPHTPEMCVDFLQAEREALRKRVDELLIANSRYVDKVREEQRLHRMQATSQVLHAEALNDIAELVGLKEGNYIKWLEPCEVLEAVQELKDTKDRLCTALDQVQWAVHVPDSPNVGGFCPMCEQPRTKGHSPDCLVGMSLDMARSLESAQ